MTEMGKSYAEVWGVESPVLRNKENPAQKYHQSLN